MFVEVFILYSQVIENVGGRLLLRYDAPEDVFEEFWLFFTDSRLRFVGFAKSKGFPYILDHPENSQNITFDETDWQTCLTASLEDCVEYPFPTDVLPVRLTFSSYIYLTITS